MLGLTTASIGSFDVHGGGNGVKVAKFSWKKSPRTQRIVNPRRHGSLDQTRFYSGRLFDLAGYIVGLTDANTQARLDSFEQALALSDSTATLQFRLSGRAADEVAEVRVDGDLEYEYDAQLPTVLKWAVTLFAEDPRIYAASTTTVSYDPTGGGSVAASNGGNFKTPATFTLDGPAVDPVITNGTDTIDLTGLTMVAGDTLVIDVAARSVTLNDVASPELIVAPSTAWFDLAPGSNAIQVNGSGFSSGVSQLSVAFRDARI